MSDVWKPLGPGLFCLYLGYKFRYVSQVPSLPTVDTGPNLISSLFFLAGLLCLLGSAWMITSEIINQLFRFFFHRQPNSSSGSDASPSDSGSGG